MLARLLEPLDTVEADMRHCVRCHQNVDFSLNHGYACRIEHTGPPFSILDMLDRSKFLPGQTQWQVGCCNHTWRGDAAAASLPPEPFCVVGRHTDSVWDVQYCRAVARDTYTDDLGSDFGYDGPVMRRTDWQIPRCKDLGCA